MAQYGALGYAKHGWTYDRILAHYYPGTQLAPAPVAKVRVLIGEGKARVSVTSAAPFRARDAAGTLKPFNTGPVAVAVTGKHLALPVTFLPGSAPLELDGKPYRGSFEIAVAGKKLQVVDVVSLDRYLYGVVTSEMDSDWPAEALKAQAVAARSYALANTRTGAFDLYSDTRSQAYGGMDAETPAARAAVDATARQVLLYNGKVADTFFSASSGGRTADATDVWANKPIPYLVSVPDPYDTLSPYHDWGPMRFTPAALGKRLGARGRLIDVKSDTAASGRVRTLTVIGTKGDRTITGAAARAALGMRSTWFTIGMLNLTPPTAAVIFGAKSRLAGIARGVGKVTLESRPYGGQWKPLAPLTSRNGQVAATLSPKVSTDYRLSTGQIRSGVVRLSVAPFVRITPSSDRLSLTGLARPLLPGATVQLQRQSAGSWTTVTRTTVNADGTFSGDVEITPGAYRARVVAGKGFAVGLSKVLTVGAQ